MSEIAKQMRSRRQRWAEPGSGHDRIVAIMQAGLPMAIGVLAAFLVMAPLFKGGDVSFLLAKDKVDVAKERLKIQSATYRGEDDKGRAFTLVAGQAVQKSSAEPVVRMKDLAAQIQLSDGPARLVAQQGRYDMDSQKVKIEGPIKFRAADGYQLDTRDATVDLRTRTMKSDSPVSGRTPLGTFSGDELSADLEKRIIRIDGNAHLRIVPKQANRR
ncbi:LPS export ABC transporter periplasmic protein LptC [Stakelama marina]|uniref:LPS export ABC transporter periplasmic protein LptC n=1 Tax=Stakelama marina TaxID=2826939 RepID=A0A8T4IFR9_9SPHN|nr:LPS export ABC transporter periplasmic protein LptC [Stakelama marina]MBR0553291.1 LPS export ABC transporter periplasmic protein LptC [Stakelama marina]